MSTNQSDVQDKFISGKKVIIDNEIPKKTQ